MSVLVSGYFTLVSSLQSPGKFLHFQHAHTDTHSPSIHLGIRSGCFLFGFFVLFILGGVEFCLFVLFGLFLVLRGFFLFFVFLDLAIRQRDLFEGWRKEQTLFGQMY